jgi:ankyrin repeat protein
VDMNSRSLTGRIPLWWPSAYGDLDVVRWLLDKNADPHISDNDGITPLAKASLEGQDLVVQLLERHQAILTDEVSRPIPHREL